MARTLAVEHRKAISEGLRLHHKRKRRGKTLLGRVVNKLTSKTRRQQRVGAISPVRRSQLQKVAENIKENRESIMKLRVDLKETPPRNPRLIEQREAIKRKIVSLQEGIAHLKKYRMQLRAQK